MKETDTKRISFDEMPAAMATMMEDIRQIKNSLLHPDEPVQKKRDPISFERACEIVGKAKNTMYPLHESGSDPALQTRQDNLFLRGRTHGLGPRRKVRKH